MTSADVEAGQSVSQATTEPAVEKKENGHMNGNSIENGDANGRPHEPDKNHHSSGHHSSKDKDRHKSHKSSHHSSSKDKDKHRSSSSHHSSSKDKDRHRSDKDKHRSSSDKHRDKDKHRSSDSKSSDKDKHRSSSDKHRSDKDRKSSSSHKDKERHSSSHKDKDRHSSSHRHSSSSSKDKERRERKEKERQLKEEEQQQQQSLNNGDFQHHQQEEKMEVDHAPYNDFGNDYVKDEPISPVKQEPTKMTLVSETVVKGETYFDATNNGHNSMVKEEASEPEDNDVKDEDDDDSSDDEPLAAKLARVKQSIKPAASESDEDSDVPLAVKLAKAKANNQKTKKKTPTKKRKSEKVEDESGTDDSENGGRGDGVNETTLETGYSSDSDDSDMPLSEKLQRFKAKRFKAETDSEEEDDSDDDASDDEMKNKKRPSKTPVKTPAKKAKKNSTEIESPRKKKKPEEEEEVWKWWEEEKKPEGVKWNSLEHKGPVFAADYEPLPANVPFYYNGKKMKLSPEAEEIATFYARMLDHDYTQKDSFNNNFFHDWRKSMTAHEKETITDLKKCEFSHIAAYYKELTELRKNRTKEEKLEEKKKNENLLKEFGFCIIDGHKQKIGNFKIEPPGLFRGRGEHPKMGKLKRRTQPEDVIINISKGAPVPQPPPGHKWKEVRHDNTVTWLCCWTENVLGNNKYIMLNPSSKLKGEKDFQKYETARRLKKCVKNIRENYQADWKSKEMRIRQRAVALYFIDKLALRAGNEKDADEQADTVGCCSLRVEHVRLHDEWEDKENVVEFDFLGKDSIRYQNWMPVEKRVFKNLKLFCENKKPGDDLFDRLNTSILNKHLNELMEGLTAKVFRTYNASKTLQEQLDQLTDADMSIPEKLLAYNRANRAVAVLCNHQRAVPKTFEKSMENLQKKIDEKEDQIADTKREFKEAKRNGDKATAEKKQKRLAALDDQLKRLKVQATDREENKQIALGTSKLNYLDPRISVAWCKKWGVPIDKVYNKTQRDKFRWAIEMAEADYKF